jgi:hypothetical protein
MSSRTFPTVSDYIDCGAATVLQNINIGAMWAWVYTLSAAANAIIAGKSSSTVFKLTSTATNRISFVRARATTATEVVADGAAMGVTKWVFIAVTWNTGGANADQKIFSGDLRTIAAEPGAYTTQTVGSGAETSDAGSNYRIGGPAGAPFTGRIAVQGVIAGRQITLSEARSLQFRPRPVAGTVGLWWPGRDNETTVPDLSGTRNAGTVTGSPTRTPGVPLMDDGQPETTHRSITLVTASGLFGDRRRRFIASVGTGESRER